MKIKLNEYKSNILKLFTGTSIAQLIPIISSPILTRLYEPSHFGLYANFLALSAILSIIVTLRFEMAIVIPNDDIKAKSIFQLAVILTITLTLILQIIIYIISRFEIDFQIGEYIYLLPLSVFAHAIYNTLYYLNLRHKNFRLLANVRIISAANILIISLITPYIVKGPLGLIISSILAFLLSCAFLYIGGQIKFFNMNLKKLKSTIYEFKKFPIFDLPSAFLIQFSNRLPVILLSNFFPISTIGHYSLTQRMLDLPTSFVTSAISDTFKQKAANDFNKEGNCLGVFYETRKILFILALAPFLIIQFLAPQIFALLFGKQWEIAGEYAQLLAFMFLLRFIVAPLTYTFYIRDKMKNNFYGQLIKFALNVFALSPGIYFNNIKLGLILFAITNIIVFIFYYFYALKYAKP